MSNPVITGKGLERMIMDLAKDLIPDARKISIRIDYRDGTHHCDKWEPFEKENK